LPLQAKADKPAAAVSQRTRSRRDRSGARTPAQSLLLLQAAVGNRAVSRWLGHGDQPTGVVQRCGGQVHEGCACAGSGRAATLVRRSATTTAEDPAAVSRQEEAAPAAEDGPAALLRRGSRGRDVAAVQTLLNSVRAIPVLEVDEAFGPQTEAAVRFFQDGHRLVADGIVGPETRMMLDRETALHGIQGGTDQLTAAGPCHTPDAPGPDDATSPTVTPQAAQGLTANALAITTTTADATPGGPPAPAPPPQQRAPDLVVQLTSDAESDALAAAHGGGAAVVKVPSPDALRDLLAARKNIGRLVIVSHATTEGEIRFDIGTALSTVKLSDLASKVRQSASVREIVFLGCTVGKDPDGLKDMKQALAATASEGTNCHLIAKKIGPLTADGVPIDTEQKYQALSAAAKAEYDKGLRERALLNRGNCIVQLRPGQTLKDLSDAQLRAFAMQHGGVLITHFTQEDGTCWKDLKFGGKDRCHRVQR
jgi:peptidoglycan hydrolase-like protein with peptidoglycan-binding domain